MIVSSSGQIQSLGIEGLEHNEDDETWIDSCGAILILVIAYKLYKLKCDSTSSCGRYISMHASNPGGTAGTSGILDQVQHGQNSV